MVKTFKTARDQIPQTIQAILTNYHFIKGFEASITLVADTIRLHGPFHGIIGFSQGAALAAIICLQSALRKFKKYDAGFGQNSDGYPKFPVELGDFKFAIFFSGFLSHSSQHSHIYKVYITLSTLTNTVFSVFNNAQWAINSYDNCLQNFRQFKPFRHRQNPLILNN